MIRPYQAVDLPAVLTLLALNTPTYFAPKEKQDYVAYLSLEREDYYVYEKANTIVGAAGINYVPEEQLASLSWDIVHPQVQGQGIGRTLTEFRLDHITQQSGYHKIRVRTSQLAYRFYQKFGFTLIHTQQDYWGQGLHLYHMEKFL